MSFLEKIGLKNKKTDSEIPPPPAPKQQSTDTNNKAETKSPAPDIPPKPEIKDLPSRKSESVPPAPVQKTAPEKQETKQKPQQEVPPMPKKEANTPQQEVPPMPKQPQESPKSEPREPLPEMKVPDSSTPKPSLSREELRKAFDDVPPIKSPQKVEQKQIPDEAIKTFEVNNMVLPDDGKSAQDDEESVFESNPSPQKATSSAPKTTASPKTVPEVKKREESSGLYISIDVYDDIQKRVNDLRKQVASAGSDIDAILDDRDKEDESFASFIKDLESIQEDLIKIDEDLFTQQ